MNQDILDNEPQESPSESSGILRWLIVAFMFALIAGGGIWYYTYYIKGGGKIQPSPSVEVTEAPWKTKSEKTVSDFFEYWSESGSSGDKLIFAKKAKDLLTISAQAKLETFKDNDEIPVTDISKQLDMFIGANTRTKNIQIISTTKIDEKNVQVKVSLLYEKRLDTIINLMSDNNIWLIDKFTKSDVPFAPALSPSGNSSSLPSTIQSQ